MTKTGDTLIPIPLIGQASPSNRGAFHWAHEKLACLANNQEIFLVNTNSLQVVQVLSGHGAPVTHVLWLPSGRQFVSAESKLSNRDILSVDENNQIVVWDALKGEQVGVFLHPEGPGKTILDIRIPNGSDLWVRTKVYVLYAGNVITMFDYVHGSSQSVSIVNGLGADSEYFLRFAEDPYNPYGIAFLGVDGNGSASSVGLCRFWDVVKHTKISVSERVPLTNVNQNVSPIARSTSSSSLDSKKQTSSSSIRKLVSDIIVGQDITLGSSSPGSFNGNMKFHLGIKDSLIVSTETHIYLVNVQFMTVVHSFIVEKSQQVCSPLAQLVLTNSRPCLVTVHENGTLVLRKYTISGMHTLSMGLETVCCSDNPRFSGKKVEVVACAIDPVDENNCILYLSDGRLLQYVLMGNRNETLPVETELHLTTPATPHVPTTIGFDNRQGQPTSVKSGAVDSPSKRTKPLCDAIKSMAEPDSLECNLSFFLKRVTHAFGQFTCLNSRAGLLIAGTSAGFVIVLKIVDFRLQALKKFTTHSNSPVNGIEFVSDSEVLTWSNLNFSTNPKCELVLTEVWTGASRNLKMDESHHIQTVKVSPLEQYFVLAYKNGAGPCELWDLPRRQLIKTLPSRLPSITCIHWRQPATETDKSNKEEVFHMTDLGTFLFTFRVEGNRFLNATCVKLENTAHVAGIPTALFSKDEMVYRADSNAVLVMYNTSKKTASPSTSVGRGPLLGVVRIHDSDQYILQLAESVVCFDFSGSLPKKVKILHPGQLKTTSVAVLEDWVVYVPKGSGGVRLLPLDRSGPGSAVQTPSHLDFPYFMNCTNKAAKIMQICENPDSRVVGLLSLTKEFGATEEYKFWKVVNASLSLTPNDSVLDVDAFCDKQQYKDVLVKIAQCIWSADYQKRERVAKVLLWAGESEKAAEILLDTEPSDPSSYVLNGLKASAAVGSHNLPEQSKAVLKIIATNLIACGDMDGGLELLCLLQKHNEACKYVESTNDWAKAVLLCKTALTDKQAEETLCKYAQFLNSKKCAYKAASIYAFCKKYDRAIEVLFGSRLRHLSYLLLHFCLKEGISIGISDHIKTAIELDFARFVFECGLQKESIKFCESLGDKGQDLKQELEILSS